MSWRQSTGTDMSGPTTSRAMNVNASPAEIEAACAKASAVISALEPLLSGGTRVVLTNADGATKMRKVFARKLITGEVVRTRRLSAR